MPPAPCTHPGSQRVLTPCPWRGSTVAVLLSFSRSHGFLHRARCQPRRTERFAPEEENGAVHARPGPLRDLITQSSAPRPVGF